MGINAGDVTLRVDARGDALVGYTKRTGGKRTVLVSGAVNARPPSRDEPQVAFEVDYTGGRETRGRGVAFRFRDGCRPYDGPALPMFVAGCKAPDGSYWALQSWQRLQAMRGVAPFRRTSGTGPFVTASRRRPCLPAIPRGRFAGRETASGTG